MQSYLEYLRSKMAKPITPLRIAKFTWRVSNQIILRRLSLLGFRWHYRHSIGYLAGGYRFRRSSLREPYLRYTTTVSTPVAAISLELASLLFFLCERHKPRVILDLGSGFSSYVFRKWQRQSGANSTVFTVDGDANWLARTRLFLEEENLPTENMLEWSSFLQTNRAIKADLILHDIFHEAMRAETLTDLMGFMNPGTFLIVDDMQKAFIRQAAEAFVREYGLSYFDLTPVSMDHYRRYQWCIIQKS